jgi:hypothetical protein
MSHVAIRGPPLIVPRMSPKRKGDLLIFAEDSGGMREASYQAVSA